MRKYIEWAEEPSRIDRWTQFIEEAGRQILFMMCFKSKGRISP